MSDFDGRTAIVTGAASGIGAEIARQLATAGAIVLATDVAAAALDDVVAGIRRAGGSADALVVDVTDRADLQRAVDAVVGRHGRLDYMFNNAGVGVFGELDQISLDMSDTIVDVNLRGVLYGVGIAYRQMVRQGSGHIVSTASVAGLVPVPLQAHYCATKHAVVGLSKALALESSTTGVTTTVFCPAFVESGMFDTSALHGSMAGVNPRAVVPVAPLATDVAVSRLLRGVLRRRRFVVTPFYGRLGWWLERFSPALSHHLHRLSMIALRKRMAAQRA